MSVQDKIDMLENELVDASGPLGKFVVKKQMKEMGVDKETMPQDRLIELIDRSIKNAVFNVEEQRRVSDRIRKKLVDA